MRDSGGISCVLQNQEYASSSEFTGSIGLVSSVPVNKKRKGKEDCGCGLAGLEQNYELVVILVLQQDQVAVDTGDQMTREDLCV
jgi:hypothetical protein